MNLENISLNEYNVRRNTIIQIIIVTLAFIFIVRIWPCGLVVRHDISKQQAFSNPTKDISGDYPQTGLAMSEFTSQDKKLQTFYPANEHLYKVTMYLTCDESSKETDTALFRIYDESFSCIYEEKVSFGKIKRDGKLKCTPDIDVIKGGTYYYEVIIPEETQSYINLPTAAISSLAQPENGPIYIDGVIDEGTSLIADFDYTMKLSVFRSILYIALIIIFAAALYAGLSYLLWYIEPYFEDIIKYGRIVATAVIAIAALVSFIYAVVINAFGGAGFDRLVYAVGIVALTVWIVYVLWNPSHYRRKTSRLSPQKQASFMWRNYIQTVCFGLLFYALCQYVNADREYLHYTNTRWMLILLGIAFLVIWNFKALFNVVNYIWLGVSVVGSVIYCHGFIGDEKELYLARLSAAAVIIWGLVILTMIRNLYYRPKKKFWKNIYWPMAVLWLIFSIFMYIFRYEKTWVFTATLPFCMLLVYNLSAAGKSRLLKNFTNGIILNFALVMLFCLMHRPYHYWMLYRYNGFFHTVACTGMYLAVIFGAALGSLFGKLKGCERIWEKCRKELFVIGVVMGCILLTMSRTAVLTSAVTFILVVVLSAVTYRKNLAKVIQECAVVALAMVIGFPLTYSAVRIVPSLVNDPIRYDVEPHDMSYMIYEGDAIDSGKYMTIERYFGLFFGRFQSDDDSENEEAKAFNDENMLLAFTETDRLPVMLTMAENDTASSLENDESDDLTSESSGYDVSNGRFEIFKQYLKASSLGGHPKMAIIAENGEEIVHAHNSYIQVIYNFGIIAGIVYCILCALTLWRSCILFYRNGKKYNIYMVPFAIIIVFGIVSLTEWAFHPCIPAGFAFLFVQMLLMQNSESATGN